MTAHSFPTDLSRRARSCKFWILLGAALIVVTGLSLVKDWWLTGDRPNILFYLLVPLVDVLGAAAVITLTGNLFGQELAFRDVLALNMGVSIVMQLVEIIAQVIYYQVQTYPGLLYLAFSFALYPFLLGLGLVRWARLRPWIAFMLAVAGLIGSWLVVVLFTSFTGLSGPGL
ncbi:MAG: hypothetical protein GX552_13700 [Chloroflexi bacterium]|jgi:hypothetical protein|nr:hypothetical protein [Chloroflexota bacterium]